MRSGFAPQLRYHEHIELQQTSRIAARMIIFFTGLPSNRQTEQTNRHKSCKGDHLNRIPKMTFSSLEASAVVCNDSCSLLQIALRAFAMCGRGATPWVSHCNSNKSSLESLLLLFLLILLVLYEAGGPVGSIMVIGQTGCRRLEVLLLLLLLLLVLYWANHYFHHCYCYLLLLVLYGQQAVLW